MIAILDYNAGNLTSVQLALRETGLDAVITRDANVIAAAERLIFPGVGAAGSAMEGLRELNLEKTVRDFVATGKPFLGICIGCQVILETSEEDGGTSCLGIFSGSVKGFKPGPGIKVPHMGWNQVRFARKHPVIDGIPDGAEFYFVHGFYPAPKDNAVVLGETEYGGVKFPSLMARNNVVACQFHAEKSGPYGLRLLKNFCAWNGKA
ncbi:MAG TPA: imidazole glycerol phosphate synthase subunit HisH [Fibrobacteres bacterium]|jgi:glutamine amidotransferase|nr:imidazole glycerol phosphate synthase subunit HisH [Fibrobacterota bacterium]